MADDLMPDPIFLRFAPWEGTAPDGFFAEFTGALIDKAFVTVQNQKSAMRIIGNIKDPPEREVLFEYISVLKSVDAARGKFIMLELGAGYGRWSVSAAKAIRQRKCKDPLDFFLVGVEADPAHFQMLEEHFRNNGIDPADHLLIQSAVTGRGGKAWFTTGSPREWWGQAVIRGPEYACRQFPDQKNIQVDAVTLASLLDPLPWVDLLDMDVQGEEYKVVAPALDLVDRRVKRVHIGTHNRFVEGKLRRMFRRLGWICEFDYPSLSTRNTPYGKTDFVDGIQAWVNNKEPDSSPLPGHRSFIHNLKRILGV
jgi:FkbM family methyltransferase